jgi:hypothetical protein
MKFLVDHAGLDGLSWHLERLPSGITRRPNTRLMANYAEAAVRLPLQIVADCLGDLPSDMPVLQIHTVFDVLTLRNRWTLDVESVPRLTPVQQQALDIANQRLQARIDAEYLHAMTPPAQTPSSGTGLTVAKLRQARALLEQREIVGQDDGFRYTAKSDADVPDTPLDEWTAGVEALLAGCETWQAQTQEVLDDVR